MLKNDRLELTDDTLCAVNGGTAVSETTVVEKITIPDGNTIPSEMLNDDIRPEAGGYDPSKKGLPWWA